MRFRLFTVSLILAVGAATAALAATSLKATMKTWKADGKTAASMVSGRTTFDAAELSRILETYINDSKGFEARIKGTTAEAKDLKARFVKFEADAASALAVIGEPAQVEGRLSTVLSNCKSCHDVHAN